VSKLALLSYVPAALLVILLVRAAGGQDNTPKNRLAGGADVAHTPARQRGAPLQAGQGPATDLGRCMIGEAGWVAPREHLLIAWKLHKQWKARQRTRPLWRFTDQIKSYCACLSSSRAWVRRLPPPRADGEPQPAPQGWPAAVSWVRHEPKWRAALALALSYRSKPDPCPEATDWGGDMDVEGALKKGLCVVDCGDTRNTFFRRCR